MDYSADLEMRVIRLEERFIKAEERYDEITDSVKELNKNLKDLIGEVHKLGLANERRRGVENFIKVSVPVLLTIIAIVLSIK